MKRKSTNTEYNSRSGKLVLWSGLVLYVSVDLNNPFAHVCSATRSKLLAIVDLEGVRTD